MRYRITEQGGVYTCEIPLQMKDGRILLVQGRASIPEVMAELGFSQDEFDEVGGIFGSIGKFFKKITKSKALKKAVKITKGIIKNPITTGALGIVTGGASVPFTASASAAIRLAEAAKKGGKKGKKARRLMKATLKQAKKEAARKRAIASAKKRGLVAKQQLHRVQLSNAEYKAKIKKLKAALKGRRLKKLSPSKKKKIAKVLNDYVISLKFA